MFYSKESSRGSESSHGFSNDTVVCVFETKKQRDNYVDSKLICNTMTISASMAV